jgi:hypothetical protein
MLDRRLSWCINAATPVFAAVCLADHTLAGGALRDALPRSPAELPLYGLLFGMPHIVASFFAFADPSLSRPSRRLLLSAAVLSTLALLATALTADSMTAMAALIVATMVHVTGQQCGLALGAARVPTPYLGAGLLWKTALTVASCLVALTMGGEFAIGTLMRDPVPWLQGCGALLVAATMVCIALACTSSRAGGDARPLLVAQATVTVAWLLVANDYPLLGILLLRFVHDATAFAVYARLAGERERHSPRANRLYRVLGISGRAVAFSVLPLGIALSAVAAMVLPAAVMLGLVLMHYVVEHHAWRAGSPMREALRGEA